MQKELNWKNFNWEKFQILCVYIAQNILPAYTFEEYLKIGQKQDGVDLISSEFKNGKAVTIQCKRNEKISVSGLRKIVSEFLKGKLCECSSHFFIATNADLQKKNLQLEIQKYKSELQLRYNIEFDCWDKKKIEEKLRNMWSIVALFFSKSEADAFCMQRVRLPSSLKEQKELDFIPRKLIACKEPNAVSSNISRYFTREYLDWLHIIKTHPLDSFRQCLIADAYQGKSTYLKYIAGSISGLGLIPLFVEIKDYTIQPVEKLMEKIYNQWKDIPFSDIVVIIDGLDEVSSDAFIEMSKHINEFALLYPNLKLLISCRRLFFNTYNIGSVLKTFSFSELANIDEQDLQQYLTPKLQKRANIFKEQVESKGLGTMLFDPFYLVNLVNIYLTSNKISASKIDLQNELLEISYKRSVERQTGQGKLLKHNSVLFKKVAKKFAFALQLAGTNSLNDEDLQILFNHPDERSLLQHNPLVSCSNEKWGFVSAIFQEFLSAMVLSQMKFDKVISLCTIGKETKKIRPKWVQTICTLVSLSNPGEELFKNAITLIESDNIEILFDTEHSKFSDEAKLSIIKKVIEDCDKKGTRPVYAYERKIGDFVTGSHASIEYLLDTLFSSDTLTSTRLICCRIIKSSKLSQSHRDRISAVIQNEIQLTDDVELASLLVDIIPTPGSDGKYWVDALISLQSKNERFEFRRSVYDLIVRFDLVDNYFSYGIEGIKYLNEYKKGFAVAGVETSLHEFILAAKSVSNISKLFRNDTIDLWLDNSKFEGSRIPGFLTPLMNKCRDMYEKEPAIIFPIAGFIRSIGKKFLSSQYKEVDEFLNETGSRWVVLRILIDNIFKDQNWELGSLISHECFDYILFEFEINNYPNSSLVRCVYGCSIRNKDDSYESFLKLCNDATENTLYNKTAAEKQKEFLRFEERKRTNDLKHLTSKHRFRASIKNFFKNCGTLSVSKADIEIFIDESPVRTLAQSNVQFNFLMHYVRTGKKISLNECLVKLNTKGFYEVFQVTEILSYNQMDDDAKKVLVPIIENYFNKHILDADFEGGISLNGNRISFKNLEARLVKIFMHFDVETPKEKLMEMVWFDFYGTSGLKMAKAQKKKSLSELILEKLSVEDTEIFKTKLVDNLSRGIQVEGVLGNHIALCGLLGITEAKEIIWKIVTAFAKDETQSFLTDAIEIYLNLGGDRENLADLFTTINSYNSYLFYYLCQQLADSHSEVVGNKGQEAINASDTTDERKLAIAHILSCIGLIGGFKYLVNYVGTANTRHIEIQSEESIKNIPTDLAFRELESITHLIEPKKKVSIDEFYGSGRTVLIEWLYSLAIRSEQEMFDTIRFLEEIKLNLSVRYNHPGELSNINFYIKRVLENFRHFDKMPMSVEEIGRILNETVG